MKFDRLSFKKLCLSISSITILTMLLSSSVLFYITGDSIALYTGFMLTALAMLWLSLLISLFRKRLNVFTSSLCRTLDDMMDGTKAAEISADEETLFARISHRLNRLYEVMQDNRRRIDEEHRELQELISDISHQVKTPVSNLKMVTDTLISQPVTDDERKDFLEGIREQTEKLDFLMQVMIKTSRLETGIITLKKIESRLYDTLAIAVSGIVFPAENKNISVSVNCPENLRVSHDSKWTAEVFFNIIDNAVKYSSPGGSVSIRVEQWEMYVKTDITDTGRGIPESSHAAVFRRFYREPEVHNLPGAGIGLYLAREIITRQGGYIKVTSVPGKGSTFSVFLPVR